jgi:4-hydroxybenzoate polyprenyltransferase
MKYLTAFIKLIRWPNLLLIALTQGLFYFFIAARFVMPRHEGIIQDMSSDFFILMASLLCIAAAGYIINDYFDFNIDIVNRPERVVVDRFIGRRQAMLLHILLSLSGLMLAFFVGRKVGNYWIAAGNALCILMLVLYSSTFKRKLLSGNVLVSLLIAWSVLVVYLFLGGRIPGYRGFQLADPLFNMPVLYLMAAAYAGFAFIVTLLREVVKDLEDMEGDDRYQCRTIPIVWGVPAAKTFCGVWIVVLTLALAVICIFALQAGWWPAMLVVLSGMVLPLLSLLKQLKDASSAADYHRISSRIKWIMLVGILSMVLFKFLP